MSKSIVFGANGYIGRHLVHYLKESGHEVIPCGHANDSIDDLNDYVQIDVTNPESLSKADLKVDYVFVFSGMTGTGASFDQFPKFIDVNEKGLLNILNHFKKSGARIIFPSTRLVYRGKEKVKLKEDGELLAKTIYAQNKIACESYLNMYYNMHGLAHNIFRICVPYGNIFDGSYSYGTVGFFLKGAMNAKKITLYGDGLQMRTFTHVEDICRIIIHTIKQPASENQTFNIGSEDHLSLLDAAKVVAKKYESSIENIEWPKLALTLESGDTIFDDEKILKLGTYKYLHQFNNWIDSL